MTDPKSTTIPESVTDPIAEQGDFPAPRIEKTAREAMQAIIDKPEYTDDDIKSIVANWREQRRQQAARDLERRLRANSKPKKALTAPKTPKSKKNADEGKPTTDSASTPQPKA